MDIFIAMKKFLKNQLFHHCLYESLRAKVFTMKIYQISCNNNSVVYYYLHLKKINSSIDFKAVFYGAL